MKIDFKLATKYGNYSDALYLPDDHNFSDDEIQAMKQQRLDNWISFVENPPPFTGEIPDEIPVVEETEE